MTIDKLLTMPQRVLAGLVVTVAAVSILSMAWKWHGRTEYQRGKDEMAALVKAESDKVAAVREELGKVREQAAKDASAEYKSTIQSLEAQREALTALANDRGAAIERLRATAAARTREVDVDSGDPCRAPKLRAQEAGRLLAEGQGLAIEGAGLVDTLAGLVDQGEIALGESAAVIVLAKSWARAVKMGSD